MSNGVVVSVKPIEEVSKAQEIIALHDEIKGYLKMSLEKAMRIGELLVEQKDSMEHGGFTSWIEANLSFTNRTARNYMMLFRRRDELKTETVSDLGVAGGYRMLTAPLADLKISKRESKREEEGKRIEYAKTHPEEVPVGQVEHLRSPAGYHCTGTIVDEMAGIPVRRLECVDPEYLMLKDMQSSLALKLKFEDAYYVAKEAAKRLNGLIKGCADELEGAYWMDLNLGKMEITSSFLDGLKELSESYNVALRKLQNDHKDSIYIHFKAEKGPPLGWDRWGYGNEL